LSVHQVGQYYLRADANGIVSAISNTFTVTVGAAAHIQATGGTPQSTTILTQFSLPLQATVTDSFGNVVSGVMVSFSAPLPNRASATLNPAAPTPDPNGHANTTATANGIAGPYLVPATIPGAAGASATFMLTNVAGAVGHITFVQQPSNTQAGGIISPAVVVRLTDASGNPVANTSVMLSLQP